MTEEIGSWKRANQRLKNRLKFLELDKSKADGEVERWWTKYLLLESRISKLEAEVQELKNGEPVVRVSGEDDENAGVENEILDVDAINGEAPEDSAAAQSVGLAREAAGVNVSGENDENVEVENEVLNEDAVNCDEYVDPTAAQNFGLAHEGSGRTLTRCVVEIIDSDDEFASGGNLSENELTSQRVTNYAHSDQISLQNETEMLKRKHDSSVGQNDNNDEAIVGRNKLQKVIHVHDGSPENHGSATDNNVETYLTTPLSHFLEYLKQFVQNIREERATRNRKSGFRSNVSGGSYVDENSSSSSSSSSYSNDDVNMNSDFSQLIRQQDDKNWEYESDVIDSLVKDDELCLKAVCALYRQRISLGTSPRNRSSSSSQGFNHLNVLRGTTLANFLVDGDPHGRLKKSVLELLQFDRRGLDDCRRIAIDHSKQLLEIYKKKEDPLFLPLS